MFIIKTDSYSNDLMFNYNVLGCFQAIQQRFVLKLLY